MNDELFDRHYVAPGSGLKALQELFAKLSDTEKDELLDQAIAWARSTKPIRELVGRVLTPEEIKSFKTSQLANIRRQQLNDGGYGE